MSELIFNFENLSLREAVVNTPRVDLKCSRFGPNIQLFEFVNDGYKHLPDFLQDISRHYCSIVWDIMVLFEYDLKTLTCLNIELEATKNVLADSVTMIERRKIYIHTDLLEINAEILSDLKAHFDRHIFDYLLKKVHDILIKESEFTLKLISQLNVQIFNSTKWFENRSRGKLL